MSLPDQILLDKYKDLGFVWQGEVATGDLERLSDELSAKQADAPPLQVECRLTTNDGITRLFYAISGSLWVPCHRCLEAVCIDITGNYGMALLPNANSDTLAKLGEGEEYVLFGELADSRYLPIKDFLEDELLLALPTLVTHNDCQLPEQYLPKDDEDKENPFAMLAQLKGRLS